ncbi:MAG: exodeoxyribonuclease III [Acidobacteria bacterium]|nr:exodeoxyribonuclease III [Acidobacteriota bacterium]
MRIYTWNVNGFRAVLKKGFLEWLAAADPDVLCLQETRAEWEQVEPDVRARLEAAFDVCWFPATAKKGYAGTATLSRKALGIGHTRGLGIEDHDREGRVILSDLGGALLVNGYFPNASQGLVRLPYKRQFAADLCRFIRERHAQGRHLVITGDLNVAPEEIDLANPATNRLNPGFTDEEREDFRAYLACGTADVLRERRPGEKGLYTWWSQRLGARARNVGWRIDIFLVSHALREKVTDAAIHPEVPGSDHCPVSLDLAL